MTDYQFAMVDVVFGSVELQQRTVWDGSNRMGYENRTVAKDRNGIVTKVSEWEPPFCWLVFSEPVPVRKPWWARLFGAALADAASKIHLPGNSNE